MALARFAPSLRALLLASASSCALAATMRPHGVSVHPSAIDGVILRMTSMCSPSRGCNGLRGVMVSRRSSRTASVPSAFMAASRAMICSGV